MPDLPNPVYLAIPAFVILMVLEYAMLRSRRRAAAVGYEPRDTVTSLLLGIGSVIAGVLSAGAVYAVLVFAQIFAVFDTGFAWWAWIACFVLDDLAYYAYHRFGHRSRWGWAAHVVHHSSQHYNLSTALRQTWTGFFTFGVLFRVPLVLIGFAPEMVLFVGAINLIYQFWIHTELVGRMPRWFEAVMNTPSHHRVHHGTNPRYLDANYAGVFIVWDKLFGSFVPENDAEPVTYGLVTQLGSFNLINAAFHEWLGIARDVRAAPWRHKLSYMWREPGWSHDGSRETTAMIRARAGKALSERNV